MKMYLLEMMITQMGHPSIPSAKKRAKNRRQRTRLNETGMIFYKEPSILVKSEEGMLIGKLRETILICMMLIGKLLIPIRRDLGVVVLSLNLK